MKFAYKRNAKACFRPLFCGIRKVEKFYPILDPICKQYDACYREYTELKGDAINYWVFPLTVALFAQVRNEKIISKFI